MTLVTGLEERLRAVSGVKTVEVQRSDDSPGRIRIGVDPKADRREVMEAVREIVGTEGLRVRAAPPRDKVQPMEPPPPPSRSEDPPSRPVGKVDPAPSAVAVLASIGMEEGPDQVRVSVEAADGRRATRRARPGRRGIEEAILQAVSALLLPDEPIPALISVEERPVDEHLLLSVVLETGDGEARAGAALARSQWSFAFARAVWAALTLDG